MDPAGPKKKSDDAINSQGDSSVLDQFTQDWRKLFGLDIVDATRQLYGQSTQQSQNLLRVQRKLINEAYESHSNSDNNPIHLWFELCETILESAKTFTQQSFEAANLQTYEGERKKFIDKQIELLFQPTNFLWSNRKAINKAFKSKGESLRKGLAFMSEDASLGSLNLSPPKAFTIGETIAQTNGHVIYKNDLIELIQYEPKTKKVTTDPILIVPPFINKFYILDLQESNSLVHHLITQGITVFMISWKNPTEKDVSLTWDDYVAEGVFSSIDTILKIYPKSKINIAGYCIGGTLAAVSAAILVDSQKEKIASLTLLNTLLDFSDVGEISNFLSKEFVEQLSSMIGKNGIFPGSVMGSIFSALRPKELIWNHVEEAYLKGEEPTPFDLLHWNADNTNISGPLLVWYLKEMYLENNLQHEDHLKVLGKSVNLSSISCPCFVVASSKDHIVPWQTAYKSALLLNVACEFILTSGGHVAGIISPQDNPNKGVHYLKTEDEKIRADLTDWLAESSPLANSWWPHWTKWIKKHSVGNRSRRKSVGNKKFKPIARAPGEYVKN